MKAMQEQMKPKNHVPNMLSIMMSCYHVVVSQNWGTQCRPQSKENTSYYWDPQKGTRSQCFVPADFLRRGRFLPPRASSSSFAASSRHPSWGNDEQCKVGAGTATDFRVADSLSSRTWNGPEHDIGSYLGLLNIYVYGRLSKLWSLLGSLL